MTKNKKNFFVENKSTILQLLPIILLIFVLVVSVSYAFYEAAIIGQKENVINAAQITMTYTEPSNALTVIQGNAMEDNVGKILPDYFEFTVSARASGTIDINYNIYITEFPLANTLSGSDIKFYLTSYNNVIEEEVLLPTTVDALGLYPNVANSYFLYQDNFSFSNANNETLSRVYRLRTWLSEDPDVNNTEIEDGQHFNSDALEYKFTVNVDTLDYSIDQPVCNISVDNPSVWSNSKTLTINTEEGNPTTNLFSFDRSNYTTTNTTTVTANGVYYGYIKISEIIEGNEQISVGRCKLTVDHIINEIPSDPVITATNTSAATNYNSGDWSNSVTINIANSYVKSPTTINYYQYYITTDPNDTLTGSWTVFNPSSKPVLNTNGTYYVYARAYSSEGVIGLVSAPFIVNIDTGTPDKPTIVASVANNGWTNTDVEITLRGGQVLSPIQRYEYYLSTSSSSLVGGTWTIYDANAKPSLTDDGTYYVYARAVNVVDATGAASNVYTINIDTAIPTAPTVTATTASLNTYEANTWTMENIVASVNGGTTVSPLDHYEYYLSTSSSGLIGGTWTTYNTTNKILLNTSGIYYIYARLVNQTGTASPASNSFIVKLDKLAPSCNIVATPDGTYSTSKILTIEAADQVEGSGLNSSGAYSWNGTTYSTTNILEINENGTYTAYVRDNLNQSSSCSITITNIDLVDPTVTTTVTAATGGNNTAIINARVRDNGGVVGYQVTNSAPTPTTGWISISRTTDRTIAINQTSAGTYFIHIIDEAGHTAYTSVTLSYGAWSGYTTTACTIANTNNCLSTSGFLKQTRTSSGCDFYCDTTGYSSRTWHCTSSSNVYSGVLCYLGSTTSYSNCTTQYNLSTCTAYTAAQCKQNFGNDTSCYRSCTVTGTTCNSGYYSYTCPGGYSWTGSTCQGSCYNHSTCYGNWENDTYVTDCAGTSTVLCTAKTLYQTRTLS